MNLSSDLECWKVWLHNGSSFGCVSIATDETKYDEETDAYLFSRECKIVAIIPRDNILMIERMCQDSHRGLVTGDGLVL